MPLARAVEAEVPEIAFGSVRNGGRALAPPVPQAGAISVGGMSPIQPWASTYTCCPGPWIATSVNGTLWIAGCSWWSEAAMATASDLPAVREPSARVRHVRRRCHSAG